ncbi:prostaglandin reductase 1-like isoform X2 [Cimex lectularius]|nr:prostaglandin reductase 1-like isoform X2 [Cimex lectularius]
MSTNKRLIFRKHFVGEPKTSDFELVEEKVQELKDGDVEFKALFISVDPYMRPVSVIKETGGTMFGAQVAKVVKSRHPGYKAGDSIVGYLGWQTNAVANPDKVESPFGGFEKPLVLPDFKGLPLSLALGVLGMPGNTAYFGLMELCKPKSGETVVISGAAGAVGSLVGQIAKNIGCRVVGFVGSQEKVDWLVGDLGFDGAINYKKEDITVSLREKASNGVDCYFDNVGGTMSSVVMSQMNPFGRIAVCGSISAYNSDPNNLPKAPLVQTDVVLKQLKMEGFLVQRWLDRWNEGIEKNIEWVTQGKLKYREFVTEGFEKLPEALAATLRGDGSGKALVKV